jgi:hypothetical protein
MARKKQPAKKRTVKKTPPETNKAWISMRSGLRTMTIVSLVLAAVTGYTTIPALGWWEGLLWSLGFGVSIWLVFVGFYYFNKVVRKKKDRPE